MVIVAVVNVDTVRFADIVVHAQAVATVVAVLLLLFMGLMLLRIVAQITRTVVGVVAVAHGVTELAHTRCAHRFFNWHIYDTPNTNTHTQCL